MSGPWSSPVPVGTVLAGKYRVEHVLGAGGMGSVLAATHVELDELRAIKLMHASETESSAAVERFLREARAAVKLKSEHVARVYDVGRLDDGTPYIVMEHLEGSDLSRIARKQGPLPVGEVVHIMLQACDAIAEAHALGIVHRDLKPANLFLTRHEDGAPCIKVLDFGISKSLNRGTLPDLEITTGKEVLGSPHYMSPEQMRATKDADPRSDIWSLGAIMYRLLTGKLPFPADNHMELAIRIVERVPERPGVLRPEIPPGLEEVVLRCLEKDPEVRIQSAQELAAALVPFAPPEALDMLPGSRRLRSIAPPRASMPSLADGAPISQPFIPAAPGLPGFVLDAGQSTWPSLPTPNPGLITATGVSRTAWGATGDVPLPQRPLRQKMILAAGASAVVLAFAAGVALAWRSQEPPARADAAAPPPAEPAPPPAEPAVTAAPPAVTAAPPSASTAAPEAVPAAATASTAAPPASAAPPARPSSTATARAPSRPPAAPTARGTAAPPPTATTKKPSSDPFGRSRK